MRRSRIRTYPRVRKFSRGYGVNALPGCGIGGRGGGEETVEEVFGGLHFGRGLCMRCLDV